MLGLGRPRIYQNHALIDMGLKTSDPRIRKRPKLDQQGSNCHLRSAGRPFSEEAGPKPLHMALATLSCWNPARAVASGYPCSLLPRELGAAACAHPVCRHRSQGTEPAYNLGPVQEGDEGECLPNLIQGPQCLGLPTAIHLALSLLGPEETADSGQPGRSPN